MTQQSSALVYSDQGQTHGLIAVRNTDEVNENEGECNKGDPKASDEDPQQGADDLAVLRDDVDGAAIGARSGGRTPRRVAEAVT